MQRLNLLQPSVKNRWEPVCVGAESLLKGLLDLKAGEASPRKNYFSSLQWCSQHAAHLPHMSRVSHSPFVPQFPQPLSYHLMSYIELFCLQQVQRGTLRSRGSPRSVMRGTDSASFSGLQHCCDVFCAHSNSCGLPEGTARCQRPSVLSKTKSNAA